MAALAIVAAGSPPKEPSAARGLLRRAMTALAVVLRAREEAQQPASRLSAIDVAHNKAQEELGQARMADDAELGAWLADGGPATDRPRPLPSEATLNAERKVGELAKDAAVARGALPAKLAKVEELNAKVREAQAGRDDAKYIVVMEAAKAYADDVLVPAIAEQMKARAILEGLHTALVIAGNSAGGDMNALRTAERVREIVNEATGAATAVVNTRPAERLLSALNTDHQAEL
jgi:hypothetical protein